MPILLNAKERAKRGRSHAKGDGPFLQINYFRNSCYLFMRQKEPFPLSHIILVGIDIQKYAFILY